MFPHSSGHVDWLAVTFPASLPIHFTIPHALEPTKWARNGKPANGYHTRLTNESGFVLLTDGEERQGIHLLATGETLATARSRGVTDRELCQHVLDREGRLARLDLAIDIWDGSLTPAIFAEAYAEGRLRTPAKSGKRIFGIHDTSDGFYLGSRTSERYFRAYNKAAEQGTPDMKWLRLELELKNDRANGVAHVLASEDNTRCVVNRAIGDFIQMDDDELNGVLADQSGPLPQEGRKFHNTLRWLLEQVMPAAAKFQVEHPDEDVLEAMLAVYNSELKKRSGTEKVKAHDKSNDSGTAGSTATPG